MTLREHLKALRGLIRLSCTDARKGDYYRRQADALIEHIVERYERPEGGPHSPENDAETFAWETARRECTCPDCERER